MDNNNKLIEKINNPLNNIFVLIIKTQKC